MSIACHYMGWDIGGAHLKLARVDGDGGLLCAEQFPITLWQGIDGLQELLKALQDKTGEDVAGHAVTMTGELVDTFADRDTGVKTLLELFQDQFAPHSVRVYGAGPGLMTPIQARGCSRAVASANWHATGSFVARHCRVGIMVDIGSTTTDILPFTDGNLRCLGATDRERLREDELVYTGVVRTPLMALVRRVPFCGTWQNVAAELFATTADVYRIRGDLDETFDQMAAADGAGKSVEDSIRRLARMLGMDPDPSFSPQSWRDLAGFIAERQYQIIESAFMKARSRLEQAVQPLVVGAGCGRFIARRLAQRQNLGYVDFPELLAAGGSLSEAAATCAAAVAVARLLQESMTA